MAYGKQNLWQLCLWLPSPSVQAPCRADLQRDLIFGLREFVYERWQVCDQQAVRADFLDHFAYESLIGGSDEFSSFLKSPEHDLGRI
jgi:hypothetical protein